MNALHQESRYHGLREDLYNDLEAHPITAQTDEFQFVEATQTIGCNWCCLSTADNKPKGGYDLFLRFLSEDFRTPEVLNDFHVFRSSGFNLPVMIIGGSIAASYFVIRGHLAGLWFQPNPFFHLVFFAGITFFTLVAVTLFIRLTLISHTTSYLKWLQSHRKSCITFNRSKCAKFMSDAVLIFLVFTGGFYLLARTLVGACPPNATIWEDQTCNKFAQVPFLPAEQALVMVLTIPLFQIFVKGATYPGLCLAWIISLIFTNVSIYFTGGYDFFIWMNFGYGVMMCVSYEFERVVLVNFMNLVLLRRAHEEQQSMRATIDVNTKNLSTNVHMISIVSDDIKVSLSASFANMDILQRKLVPSTSPSQSLDVACTSLTATIRESMQDISKSVDDLKVLYQIIAPEAFQYQMQDHLRRTKIKSSSFNKKREVVFEGDERPTNEQHDNHELLNPADSNNDDNDDDDGDDDDNEEEICMDMWGDDAELVSIHSSRYSTSRNQQSQQSVTSMAVIVPRMNNLEGQLSTGTAANTLALTGAPLGRQSPNREVDSVSPLVEILSPARPSIKLMWDDETSDDKNEAILTGNGTNGLGLDGSGSTEINRNEIKEKKVTIREPPVAPPPETTDINRAKQKGIISDKAFAYTPNPELSLPLRLKSILNESKGTPSPISSPDYTSAFVAPRKGGHMKNSSKKSPPLRTQSLSTSPSTLTLHSKVHNSEHHNNNTKAIDMLEEIEDCRVLSDEIAASLPSPVDVVFPFPSNHVDDNDDDESKDDSIDDGSKRGQDIHTTANNNNNNNNDLICSVEPSPLQLVHYNELVCTVEPSPLQLLVRMPPAGIPYMCDITQYGVIGNVENTRLLDVVEEMSRDDWWTKPWKTSPMLTTTAPSMATTVSNQSYTNTEAITSSKGYLRSLLVSANYGFKSIASPFLHIDFQQSIHGKNMNIMDLFNRDVNNQKDHNDKKTYGHSSNLPKEPHFMDQLTIAATESGLRLNAYLMKLSSAFHRDLRSTCDTFELLMHHFDNNDVVDDDDLFDDDEDDDVYRSGSAGSMRSDINDSCTDLSFPQRRILEKPDSLIRLHEYLVVVRYLLIQTSASLLTTMDNIVIIKATSDAYKKEKQKEKSLFKKKIL